MAKDATLPTAPANTKRVRLNCSRCGHRTNDKGEVIGEFVQQVGQEVDMPNDEADRYVNAGLADLVPVGS